MADPDDLKAVILASPLIAPLLARWSDLQLPDGWLAAGALAQTVWNARFALPANHGITDIDIVYLDIDDLSETAESAHAARIRAAFNDLPVHLDIKNEARVHLWYEAKFGYAIAPYRSIEDAVSTFPTTATAIALRPRPNGFDLCAPYGIDDLMNATVRPNKKQITSDVYATKIARWTALWPQLRIIDWDE
ncbi:MULTISPECIES: nucleotidyltransferase family protein [unclassified Rhizobium]|uniref:nucleotidyltransferase family protein n=1 Tax=unclassified Rhizobium TaxID=2613769 RepID=UPI0006FE82BA|nr:MULTISPECIES: nucleotidyltransferase family protein [unclassified Rhizobium]KQV44245.1 hypothetical protein ASC86_05585 [Rhizobium sp. Root1212]KRD38426.1 hypothetical protein ASE37_05585 [Rhizobium sp. Root268]